MMIHVSVIQKLFIRTMDDISADVFTAIHLSFILF